MQHTRTFKREDGSRVKVVVYLYTDYVGDTHRWSYGVMQCPPKGRKFSGLGTATPDEILTTKLELWQKLKPV